MTQITFRTKPNRIVKSSILASNHEFFTETENILEAAEPYMSADLRFHEVNQTKEISLSLGLRYAISLNFFVQYAKRLRNLHLLPQA